MTFPFFFFFFAFLLNSGSVGKGSALWWMILEAFMHTVTYYQCRQAGPQHAA